MHDRAKMDIVATLAQRKHLRVVGLDHHHHCLFTGGGGADARGKVNTGLLRQDSLLYKCRSAAVEEPVGL